MVVKASSKALHILYSVTEQQQLSSVSTTGGGVTGRGDELTGGVDIGSLLVKLKKQKDSSKYLLIRIDGHIIGCPDCKKEKNDVSSFHLYR